MLRGPGVAVLIACLAVARPAGADASRKSRIAFGVAFSVAAALSIAGTTLFAHARYSNDAAPHASTRDEFLSDIANARAENKNAPFLQAAGAMVGVLGVAIMVATWKSWHEPRRWSLAPGGLRVTF